MDIRRQPKSKAKKYWWWGAGGVVLLVITIAVGQLGPAVPSVEAETIIRGTVERGTMLRQVRGPGTLVPEQIRWVPAVVAGRVERKLVDPGTRVDSATVLLELSNPEVQLELLEAERQLSAADAQLVNLRTTLATRNLDQEAQVVSLRALHMAAARNAANADSLAPLGLIAVADAQTFREQAADLEQRLSLAERRLAIYLGSTGEELDVQATQIQRLRAVVSARQDRIESMRVIAGTDGVLQDMDLEEGQWILPGTVLARVVQPERLKAVLRIPQVQARDVTIGQLAFIDTRTDTIPGRVIRIDPSVQNGAVNVDIALDGELPQGARPDLSVDGVIEIERLVDVLYMGRPTFGQSNSTVGLFRIVDGDYAERARVSLGRASVNTIEVIEGLREGDAVILSDMTQWDSYDRVRIR